MDMGMTKLINKIISLNNRRTSMRLADSEWDALHEICEHENMSRNKLIECIERTKEENLGLSCCTRLFILVYYRNNATLKKTSSQNLIQALKVISNSQDAQIEL